MKSDRCDSTEPMNTSEQTMSLLNEEEDVVTLVRAAATRVGRPVLDKTEPVP